MVLKHSSNVPQSALAAEELCRAAGLPEGVFQTLLIGSDAVEKVIRDRRVAGVTLTGSDVAGSKVAQVAGAELKKTVLELGGSDPFIVLEDADLEQAARVACRARNQNNGESCIAAKRFIVAEPVADEFERRFSEAVAALKVGDPTSRDTDIGRAPGRGYFFNPTVLTEVTREMPVFRQETFGPVAAVIRVRDEQEAVEVANDSVYGLGSNLWTGDVERGRRLAGQIEAGMVFINGMVASDARLPFGGVKRSGYGRELSELGTIEFMNVQTVWVGPARSQQPSRAAE
jgi:succinate-semialdehyde dehydrogenase/glutarate-semialdehyde dehydrogenase